MTITELACNKNLNIKILFKSVTNGTNLERALNVWLAVFIMGFSWLSKFIALSIIIARSLCSGSGCMIFLPISIDSLTKF